MAWGALESGSAKLKEYLIMQCIKESSTLRVSKKVRSLRRELFSVLEIKTIELRVFFCGVTL